MSKISDALQRLSFSLLIVIALCLLVVLFFLLVITIIDFVYAQVPVSIQTSRDFSNIPQVIVDYLG